MQVVVLDKISLGAPEPPAWLPRRIRIEACGRAHPVRVVAFQGRRAVFHCTTREPTVLRPAVTNEVVAAFRRGCRPAWGKEGNLHLGPPVQLKLNIWARDADRERVIEAILAANAIFDLQGLGVKLVPCWRELKSSNDLAVSFGASEAGMIALNRATGKRRDELGLAVVDKVAINVGFGELASPSFGTVAPIKPAGPNSDWVVLGRLAGHDLLAHELGHVFGLNDAQSGYVTARNVMRPVSGWRECLTEGQCLTSYRSTWLAPETRHQLPPKVAETQVLGNERFVETTFVHCAAWQATAAALQPELLPSDCGVGHTVISPTVGQARVALAALGSGKKRRIYRVYGATAAQHAARRRYRMRGEQLASLPLGLDNDDPIITRVRQKSCTAYLEEALSSFVTSSAYLAQSAAPEFDVEQLLADAKLLAL